MADLNDDLTTRGTKNSVEGKADDLKGKAKDAWGGATGNTSEQLEGKADQLKGKAKTPSARANGISISSYRTARGAAFRRASREIHQPNVNANASIPGSKNSIWKRRSAIGPGCRTS